MNVLVVGGAGYIGSHMCYALQEEGYTPIIYDDFSSGHKEVLCPFTYIEGSIADTQKLIETIQHYSIEAVFHFAAFIAVEESVCNPIQYYNNNVTGSISLLTAIVATKVQYLILSSTASVYGTPQALLPVTEDSPIAPLNPYAKSKVMMEEITKDVANAHSFSFASLRYFNAAGADPKKRTGLLNPHDTHIIPRIFMSIAGDTPTFTLFGTDYSTPDGTCVRDYIHVTDLANAHIKALRYLQEHTTSFICNLGTNTGTSNKEIIHAVERVLNIHIPIIEAPRREGDSAYIVADASKAFALLQWKPEYSSLDTIIQTAWDWFMLTKERYAHNG